MCSVKNKPIGTTKVPATQKLWIDEAQQSIRKHQKAPIKSAPPPLPCLKHLRPAGVLAPQPLHPLARVECPAPRVPTLDAVHAAAGRAADRPVLSDAHEPHGGEASLNQAHHVVRALGRLRRAHERRRQCGIAQAGRDACAQLLRGNARQRRGRGRGRGGGEGNSR